MQISTKNLALKAVNKNIYSNFLCLHLFFLLCDYYYDDSPLLTRSDSSPSPQVIRKSGAGPGGTVMAFPVKTSQAFKQVRDAPEAGGRCLSPCRCARARALRAEAARYWPGARLHDCCHRRWWRVVGEHAAGCQHVVAGKLSSWWLDYIVAFH